MLSVLFRNPPETWREPMPAEAVEQNTTETQESQEKLGDFAGVFDDKSQETQEVAGQTQLAGTESAETQDTAGTTGTSETQQSEPALLDRIRSEYGIEAEDEQSALNALADQYGQARQYISNSQQSYGQQLEELRRQNNMLIEALQSGRQPQQQAIAPQPEQKTEWTAVKPLELSEAVIRTFRDPTTGGWKENTPPQVIQEAERYQGELNTYFDRLATSPEQVLGPGMRAIAREVLSEVFGADVSEIPKRFDPRVSQQESQIEQQWTSMQPVLFERIPNTNQLDFNVPTPLGSEFFAAMNQADSMIRATGREPGDHEAFQMALWRMGDKVQQAMQPQAGGNGQGQQQASVQQQVQPQTAEQVREERRRQHMRQQRATGVTTAGGTTQGGNVGQPERPARKQNPLLGVGSDFANSLYGENPGFNMGQ